MPPLLPNEYYSNDESDDDESDTPMQHQRRVVHPDDMTARNVYNLRPPDQTDYVKEKVDLPI